MVPGSAPTGFRWRQKTDVGLSFMKVSGLPRRITFAPLRLRVNSSIFDGLGWRETPTQYLETGHDAA